MAGWRADSGIRQPPSTGCAGPVGECVFVTNSSAPTIAEHTAALAKIGINADGDVVSSSMAAAELVTAGERVLVCGGPGVAEAVSAAGAIAIDGADNLAVTEGVDVVIAGFHRSFDYERLRLATQAVRDGARFVATNRDPLFPTPERSDPRWWVDRRGDRHRHGCRAGHSRQATSADGSSRASLARRRRTVAAPRRRRRSAVDGRSICRSPRVSLRHRAHRQHGAGGDRRSASRSRRRRPRPPSPTSCWPDPGPSTVRIASAHGHERRSEPHRLRNAVHRDAAQASREGGQGPRAVR